MVSNTFDYIAASFTILLNGFCGAWLALRTFKIQENLRLVSVACVRACYCILLGTYSGLEIYSRRSGVEYKKLDVYFAYLLLGLSMSSSWLLVQEYLIGSREL